MPTRTLTASFVKSVKPGSSRVWVTDRKQSGLQLVIYPSGKKTYVLYRRIDGKPQRIRLASASEVTPQDARRLACEMLRDIALGVDPLAERRQRRSEETLTDVWGNWLEEHAKPRKRTWQTDVRRWRLHIQPTFGAKSLSEIRQQDVSRWHRQIGETCGTVIANRSLALLRAMFNRAINKLGHECSNPAARVEQFPETARDRFLSPGEMARFFKVLDNERDHVKHFFRLLLYTGGRKSSILHMRFSEITDNTWRPTRWKNGDRVVLPLVPEAVEIIEKRRLDIEGDAVFPGRVPGVEFMSEPCTAWRRIRRVANLQDFHLHDLRRTLGSWQASQGTSLPIIGAMLGHRPGSSATAIYARLQLDAVRESAESAVTAMLNCQQ